MKTVYCINVRPRTSTSRFIDKHQGWVIFWKKTKAIFSFDRRYILGIKKVQEWITVPSLVDVAKIVQRQTRTRKRANKDWTRLLVLNLRSVIGQVGFSTSLSSLCLFLISVVKSTTNCIQVLWTILFFSFPLQKQTVLVITREATCNTMYHFKIALLNSVQCFVLPWPFYATHVGHLTCYGAGCMT